jgi:hypothetical protein
MVLKDELVLAQMYTHAWALIVVVVLVVMAIQSSKWKGPKNNGIPIAIFSVIAVLTAIATGMSMAMHSGFDDGGVHENNLLADAEMVSVTVAMAISTVCFLVFFAMTGAQTFATSPVFGYVLGGLVCSAFGMLFLYYRGAHFGKEHREVVKQRGGVEGYSAKLEQWGFYHIQWHLVGGTYAFLLAIGLFVVLKTYFNVV